MLWTPLSSLYFVCSSASLGGAVGIQQLPLRPLRLRFLQKNSAQHVSYIQHQNPLLGVYLNEVE